MVVHNFSAVLPVSSLNAPPRHSVGYSLSHPVHQYTDQLVDWLICQTDQSVLHLVKQLPSPAIDWSEIVHECVVLSSVCQPV